MTQRHRRLSFILLPSLLTACAAMGGTQERFAVCSYDHAWEAALEAVKDRAIARQDKTAGVIDTAWLEISMPGRTFGAFQRDLGDSRDRSRISLTVKRLDDVTKIGFIEERQRWAFRGGSRLFGWTDTEPSAEVMTDVQNRLNSKLKEHGCSVQ
ncbi:MAG: hypothetical protein H8K06_03960 [Nitrospira sp.]|uniref:Lipoprotein n=1 Tax=Nitrospira defluvii TaxID=330214 RepID=A0ABM8QE43_9BACT|nr:hypothetical protein [Nitrospira defluvii]MCS6326233.1 hypothetical protein [Nitrospira sp.]CAE6692288.1 conserved exported hypothetical protein [Nitrospira defluvii]